MRAIAIAGLLSLVLTATAFAARSDVAQKAAAAPLPNGAVQKKGSSLYRVACPSAAVCVATGAYRTATGGHLLAIARRGGKWTTQHAPGGVVNASLACPAVGRCVGTTVGGEQRTSVLIQMGRTWTASAVTLPADASSTPWPDLASISCGSPGNCAAVGAYEIPAFAKPLVVTESNGAWLAGAEPQPPAEAATTSDRSIATPGNRLSLVACPSAGNCTAVGTYTDKAAAPDEYPWVLEETAGHWASGVSARLPADANPRGNPERGGTAPFFGFTGLSCPSAGNCTAVGGYWGNTDVERGLILTERSGKWSRGVRAPLPPHAVPNSEPNEFNSPVTSVSCAAPTDCAAVGTYVLEVGGTPHGALLTERSGAWKASALVLPAGAQATGGVFLGSVACPSRGNCVAVGYYAGRGKTHGLLVRERGGKWERAVNVALPANAAAASNQHTFLPSVSCASASRCTVVGTYTNRSGVGQGLVVSLRLS
ncbi:MAG TPA: hypothetical protein VKO84_11450 [Gaiellaceae bacterium]|nr:hypothetical protein [Gaiellaceae bacterium]